MPVVVGHSSRGVIPRHRELEDGVVAERCSAKQVNMILWMAIVSQKAIFFELGFLFKGSFLLRKLRTRHDLTTTDF